MKNKIIVTLLSLAVIVVIGILVFILSRTTDRGSSETEYVTEYESATEDSGLVLSENLSDNIGYIIISTAVDKSYAERAVATVQGLLTADTAIYVNYAGPDRTGYYYCYYTLYDRGDNSFTENELELSGVTDVDMENVIYETLDKLVNTRK